MRPSSSPPSHSSSTPELHPVLRAAFDSLDVELEEELTLYRRQRYCQTKHGKHIPAWQPGGGAKVSATRSPQLPLLNSSADQQPHWNGEASPVKLPAEDWSVKNLASTNSESQGTSNSQPFNLPLMPDSVASGAASFSATDFSQAGTANFNSTNLAIVAALQAKRPPQYPPMATSDKTLDRLRELALRPMSADEWLNEETRSDRSNQGLVDPENGYPENNYPENLPQSGFFDSPDDYSPDGYLESTEELLNSIAEEKPNYGVEQESNLLNSLLTPLGIGSMVLLLLSSATLGYVIMHPSSLDLLTPQERTSSGNAAQSDGNPTASDFASPLIPDAPNLAAEEFVDLNLGNLSTIPGSDSPHPLPGRSPLSASQPASQPASQSTPNSAFAPSVADTEASPPASSLSAVESAAPADMPADVPEPIAEPEPVESTYTEPAPALTSPGLPSVPTTPSEMPEAVPDVVPSDVATSAVASPATPTAGGTFYVVTPYNGDLSLEQARQAVPEAYVRNFETGATVQLGVFNNVENAQELIQELQNQGIQAEVYQP